MDSKWHLKEHDRLCDELDRSWRIVSATSPAFVCIFVLAVGLARTAVAIALLAAWAAAWFVMFVRMRRLVLKAQHHMVTAICKHDAPADATKEDEA